MASVNKVSNVESAELQRLYSCEKKSIPDIAKILCVSYSVARRMLIGSGVELRSRTEGVRSSSEKLGKHMIGKRRQFSEQWKENMAAARRKYCDKTAKGVSKKNGGYVVVTRGSNKNRLEHVVIMEKHIGRRLIANEVVHHIDENKHNNAIENLMLMTRSDHTRLHRSMKKGVNHVVS